MGDNYQIKDQSSCYFFTFQVVGWADVFTRKEYRNIIIESLDYCRKNKGLEIIAYVMMTNHIHIIARSKSENLSNIVRDFKKYTSKNILQSIKNNPFESRKEWLLMIFRYHAKYNKRVAEQQLWTHENHAVELTSDNMFNERINYIHENPIRAGWVEKAEDYLYGSARNYAGLKALLEIDIF